MNEQITLLALKASDPKTGWLDRQKFAELIVRECSAFVNHFSDGHEKDQFGRKMFHYRADIGQVILEHFGVEE